MKHNKTIQPKEFLVDYSPTQSAELFVWVFDETPKKNLAKYFQTALHLLKSGFKTDENDLEAEKIWRDLVKKWGQISRASIMSYFEEKYDTSDHLRKFEYSFLAKCLAREDVRKRVIVDMGGGHSYSTIVPMLFRFPEAQIISVDVVHRSNLSKYGVRYVRGDCMQTGLPGETADVVAIISTLEHVGLGRWGDPLAVNGDIQAMQEAWRILKPGGHVVLTIPYGFPTVVYNLHRIYDEGRVSLLTRGFDTVIAEYTIHGRICNKCEIEGMKAITHIPGFYEDQPDSLRFPNPQGGALLLLRKP